MPTATGTLALGPVCTRKMYHADYGRLMNRTKALGMPGEERRLGDMSEQTAVLDTLAHVVKDHVVPQRLTLLVRGMVSREWTRVYRTSLGAALDERCARTARIIAGTRDALARRNTPMPLACS